MAPAGTKNHHAYHGGLLEHVVNLMEVVLRVSPCYPQINRDLLLMGAFLHDLGKTEELSYDHGLSYSDEGQLIGHLVMAVGMLDPKLAEAEKLSGEPIPAETVLRLKHMILSHHGEYAFGSPKLPMTLEAVALCQLDNLDAKINTFSSLMKEDPNVDSPWTTYNPNLDRKLFKGAKGRRVNEEAVGSEVVAFCTMNPRNPSPTRQRPRLSAVKPRVIAQQLKLPKDQAVDVQRAVKRLVRTRRSSLRLKPPCHARPGVEDRRRSPLGEAARQAADACEKRSQLRPPRKPATA